MLKLDYKRLIIEKLIFKINEEVNSKNKNISTVDPIIRMGRKLFPFMSDNEIQEYATVALRIILNTKKNNYFQTTLL